MADLQNKEVLISLENLKLYDTNIKKYIDAADAPAIKTVLWDSTNEQIKFFKKENATLEDTADFFVSVSSSDVANLKTRVGMDSELNAYQAKSNLTDILNVITGADTVDGSVAKIVKDAIDALDATVTQDAGDDGLALSITQTDGKITAISGSIAAETYDEYGAAAQVKTDVIGTSADEKSADTIYGAKAYADDAVNTLDGQLKAIAKSGNASDVAIADAAEKLTATNVEGALLEIVNKADANASAIETLNGDGAGSVAKAIEDAIDALDGNVTGTGTFVKTISQEDGVVTATLGGISVDEVPDLTLAKITDAGTAAAANVATVAIGAEGEDGSALPSVSQVETYVADQVKTLEGAMHFVGVITRNEGETDEQAIARVITNPTPGDVIVMADNSKEYIFVDPDPEQAGDEVWREIGDEGLYVHKSTTIAGVDLQDNITKDELLTALNVADGAQVNVLEGVQVNGTDLAIDGDKKVNVTVAEGATNGTIAVNGVDVNVHGLDGAAYKAEDYYEVAGTAQGIVDELDSEVSTVTVEDPTPVLAVTITQEEGKLTGVTASAKTADDNDILGLFANNSDATE